MSTADVDTVAGLLRRRADDHAPGLRTTDGGSWTWSEVVAECDVRASILGGLTGDRPAHVGVLLPNVPEYVFLLGGAALSGSVIVGINPTRRGEELARDVRHTGCRLVVTDREQAPLLAGLDLGGAEIVEVDDPAWRDRLASHAGPAALDQPPVPDQVPAPDDLFLLLFTSGSTAAPKAVRMSQGRAAHTAAASAVAFTPDDVLYCAMPIFHGNALLANLLPGVVAGATVVLRPRFSASAFLPDVREHGCTFFNYVGRALSYVLATPEAPDDADNPLKWGLGSEASPHDQQEFRRRFRCLVIEGYSSSEGAVVIQPFPGMPTGALGRAADGCDVAVLDPDTGRACPAARFDETGRLVNADEAIGEIVGHDRLAAFEGYHDNPEADAARSRDGFYWTGDLAYRDADGTFYFAGRANDWLRVDGENFSATPVERVLGRFPGVAAAVVYAVPDPRTADQVMAAVELDTGTVFDPATFEGFLAEQADLGTKWTPRFVRVVEALPVTANGKLDRTPLRAQRWTTTDPVWWRPQAGEPYRVLDGADIDALHRAFTDNGHEGLLT